jgi:hypothetical protein
MIRRKEKKMNEKKLPLWNEKQRKVTESNTVVISDDQLIKKIQSYHDSCVEWQKKVEELLNENQ